MKRETVLIDTFIETVHTIPRMFNNTLEIYPTRPALKFKVDGHYVTMDYQGFAKVAEEIGSGLIALGVEKGDKVSIMAHNSMRWAWADIAILSVGAVNTTAYPSLSAEEVSFIVNHADVKILMAGTVDIARRVESAWDKMPGLQKIVIMDAQGYVSDDERIITLTKLMELGRVQMFTAPGCYKERWEGLGFDDPCSIIFTSGTTGQQKGILLTHGVMMAALARSMKQVEQGGAFTFSPEGMSFSLMPLAHIWERNNSYFGMMATGGCIGFGETPATLLGDIQMIKPTWILLVPRVWDRLFSGFRNAFSGTPEGKKLFDWAMDVGRKVMELRTKPDGTIDTSIDPMTFLEGDLKDDFEKANNAIFSAFYRMLGGRLQIPYSGGAALPEDLQRNYLSMNFPLLSGWGLTETAAGISHCTPDAVKPGWLSPMVPGVEAKIAEDGEILVRGAGIFSEYYKNEAETRNAFTDDGWYMTGDIGEFDEFGILRITDRKKSIIVLDTGKNVAPAKIESCFVNSILIDQIVSIGSERKYVSALVSPAFDVLLPTIKAKGVDYDESKLVYGIVNGTNSCVQVGEDVVSHPVVQKIMEDEIDRHNEALEEHERIRRFTIVPRKFSEEMGELTPTLKIKYKVVLEHFKDEIEAMYNQ